MINMGNRDAVLSYVLPWLTSNRDVSHRHAVASSVTECVRDEAVAYPRI